MSLTYRKDTAGGTNSHSEARTFSCALTAARPSRMQKALRSVQDLGKGLPGTSWGEEPSSQSSLLRALVA